ncbi:unnamed protein product [Paramecium primaurelia]|uniref:G domain-containing protein n=1 Tax=Paramecium primaurelia TaxID=5886 RepID=A0A8S1Q916_PARPR|nr:unnamed protein product [Paramecium primaurelia]
MDQAILLKLIEKCQEILDYYSKHYQQTKISTVLLVGLTGSGKSTIFNFLSGANFQFNAKSYLEIINKSDNYSKINEGMISITKAPNYFFNKQNNHLIIDFPGFQDTNGDFDQLLFDLLFNKIVTTGSIKLIYIQKNPEAHLLNRGTDLQQFLKQLKNPKISLLLNSYLDDLPDEELIQSIKQNLTEVNLQNSIDKILVLRKAKKSSLNQIFNDNSRKHLWSQIEQVKENKIEPQQLNQSEKISFQIQNLLLTIMNEYLVLLNENFDQKYKNLFEKDAEDILKNMQELLDFVKNGNKKTPYKWYLNFIAICEKMANNLSIKNQIIDGSKNFIKIFQYFEQFSHLISGYNQLDYVNSIAKYKLKMFEELFNSRKEALKKSQIDYNIMKLYQQQLDNNETIEKLQKEKFELHKEIEKMKIEKYEQQIKINQLKEELKYKQSLK